MTKPSSAENYDFGPLRQALSELEIAADDAVFRRLSRYWERLKERSGQMNLTAITSFEDVCTLHFLDAAALVRALPGLKEETLSVLDIGSGAGVPGFVLKMIFPALDMTLLEAQGKRVSFLREVIADVFGAEAEGFPGVRAVRSRAEEAGRSTQRGRYDLCTARAVSELRVLAEYALPLLKTGGIFAAYKSIDTDEEIKACAPALLALGGSLRSVQDLVLPGTDIKRRFVLIEKTRETPERYPRRTGIPEKRPL